MILLEVMIALALIVVCILPLISPHSFLLQQQKKFVSVIKLDHTVNLLYVDVLERLHKNEIPWISIQECAVFPIDELLIKRLNNDEPLPFKGSYRFEEIKGKTNDKERWGVHLLKLTFSFLPNEAQHGSAEEQQAKVLNYSYQIFVVYNSQKDPLNQDASLQTKSEQKDTKVPAKKGE